MSYSAENSKKVKSVRLQSLDALRGFDMFWIVSGEGIFHGIASAVKQKYSLVQNVTDWRINATGELNTAEKIFVGISNQLHHSVWNGFTFYDLIFPLFIFIAGVSMPWSFGNQLDKAGINISVAKKNIYRSLIKRTIILILLGMVVNGVLKFEGYENIRFASVLGRIALSCFFAALIYLKCRLKNQIIWFAGIVLVYFAAMMLIPVPGFGAGILTPEGNLSAYIDRLLLPGKLHRTVYDPEGLLSTIPAAATALLGVFTGSFLRSTIHNFNPPKKVAVIAGMGILLIGLGLLWNMCFPINKTMWTSSFVLYAGGWSMIVFAAFYFIIDVRGVKNLSNPFVWMGMNSILIYMAAHGIVNFESSSQFLFGGFINKIPEQWHPALLWAGVAVIQFALLWFLYRKKWFLKL